MKHGYCTYEFGNSNADRTPAREQSLGRSSYRPLLGAYEILARPIGRLEGDMMPAAAMRPAV